MTLGSAGAVYQDAKVQYRQSIFPVKAVDTTGAGDSFLGGLIYAYFYEKREKKEALDFANATAAIKCMQEGPRSRASVEQVQKFRDSVKREL